jgi:hypothetical protein
MLDRKTTALVIFALNALESAIGHAHAQPVVYTSADQEYPEIVLKSAETAVVQEATAVFGADAAKSVGLERRLFAEESDPKADIFWNSEFLRTHRLDKQVLLAPTAVDKSFGVPAGVITPHSVGVGIRGRVIALQTASVRETDRPKRLEDLADPRCKGKGAALPGKGGPNAAGAHKPLEYLVSKNTETRRTELGAVQLPVRPNGPVTEEIGRLRRQPWCMDQATVNTSLEPSVELIRKHLL